VAPEPGLTASVQKVPRPKASASLRASAELGRSSSQKLRPSVGFEDPNSFLKWLDAASTASRSTAPSSSSSRRALSQAAETASETSSVCSFPGTAHQAQFRNHRRGFVANVQEPVTDQHADGQMKDGVPKQGFVRVEKEVETSYQDSFGIVRPAVSNKEVQRKKCGAVFQVDKQEFIADFLDGMPVPEQLEFNEVVRGLDSLRTQFTREHSSTTHLALNLEDARRLWDPPRQMPVFDPSQINLSTAPLPGPEMPRPLRPAPTASEQPQTAEEPHSPRVSDLGSIRLASRPPSALLSRPSSAQSISSASRPKSAVSMSRRSASTPTSLQAAVGAVAPIETWNTSPVAVAAAADGAPLPPLAMVKAAAKRPPRPISAPLLATRQPRQAVQGAMEVQKEPNELPRPPQPRSRPLSAASVPVMPSSRPGSAAPSRPASAASRPKSAVVVPERRPSNAGSAVSLAEPTKPESPGLAMPEAAVGKIDLGGKGDDGLSTASTAAPPSSEPRQQRSRIKQVGCLSWIE